MKKYEAYRGDVARDLVLDVFDHLVTSPIKTATAFRNAFMDSSRNILMINPLLTEGGDDTVVKSASALVYAARNAIADGRMIDFGYLPNEFLKAESIRSREIFEAGELPHPYEDGWFGVAWWEQGCNGYFVRPSGPFIGIAEFYGVALEGLDVAILYDSVVAQVVAPGDTRIQVAPMRDDVAIPAARRGANSLDPLVAMLRLLADASVPVSRVEAPAALNKARLHKGKEAIPAHSVVHAQDYISRIEAHGSSRGNAQGGHHASPVAHWRRSHMRHLSNDRVVKVRSSKVNWRSGEEFHRLFSKVPHD